MEKRIVGLVGLFLIVGLVAGCATLAEKARGKGAPGVVTGGVETLAIEGPTRAIVGETVTLKAVGRDAQSARIKMPGIVKPTWKSDNIAIGSLESEEGESVNVKCLSPGVVYITAVQGKADTIHAIEVK